MEIYEARIVGAVAVCPQCHGPMHKEDLEYGVYFLVCYNCGTRIPVGGGHIILKGRDEDVPLGQTGDGIKV